MRPRQADDFYYRKQKWEEKELKKKYEYIQTHGFLKACQDGVIKNIKVNNSGGKDSLAVLLWCIENNLHKICNIESVTVNIGLEYFGFEKYLEYICSKLGIKHKFLCYSDKRNIEKRKELLSKSEEFGLPIRIRYCNQVLKKELFNDNSNYDLYDISLIGNRWSESSGRSKNTYLYYCDFQLFYQPILHFKLNDIFDLLNKYDIPLFYTYDKLTRCSCAMCPLIFLRSKLSVDCVYTAQNREKYDSEFFDIWLEEIYKTSLRKIDEVYGALKDQTKLYIKNYERMKNNDLTKIKIKENNWPVKLWYPENYDK